MLGGMSSRGQTGSDRQVEAVLKASQALVAIVARSFVEADSTITLPQWRVLVILSGHGPLNPGAIAQWMGVHPSNTTRACDVLVKAGLIDRRENPEDRRRQLLTLTDEGEAFVQSMFDFRRAAIAGVLDLLPASQRKQLAESMEAFAEAAGESPEQFVPSSAWPH